MFTESALRQIMPRIPADKFQTYFLFLERVMQVHQINTPLRQAAFLAQIAHESGQLRFMEEVWGPTAQQKRYEPPSDLARRLGNTQPGDGFRYRGRGPIQLTGRFNYRKFGGLLGTDLELNPDLAATTQIAFSIAGVYWQTNGLNEMADRQDFIGITKVINGGTNGLEDRQKFYAIAKNVLGVSGRGGSFSFSSMAEADEPAPVPVFDAKPTPVKLERGFEAINDDAGGNLTSADSAAHEDDRSSTSAPSRGFFARLVDFLRRLFGG